MPTLTTNRPAYVTPQHLSYFDPEDEKRTKCRNDIVFYYITNKIWVFTTVMLKIQAFWGVTVSTGTLTDVSKGRGASIFKVTQYTKTFDVSKYGSSTIFRVNESNKCVFYGEWPWRETLTSSETLTNIWQSTRHNITEDYAVLVRKTSIWIPGLRVTCRQVEKNGRPLPVIRTRCFQTGRGEIWLFDIYSVTNDNKKETLRTCLTLTTRHFVTTFCGGSGEGKSRSQ